MPCDPTHSDTRQQGDGDGATAPNDYTTRLTEAIAALAAAGDDEKPIRLRPVFDSLRTVLLQSRGCAAVRSLAEQLEAAGFFAGTDWAAPQDLVPGLSKGSLASHNPDTVVLEAVSELRLLAVACGDYAHQLISAQQARDYLSQVLATNPSLLFTSPNEAERERQGNIATLSRTVLRYLVDEIGYGDFAGHLVAESRRILRQRPIQVDQVKNMITRLSIIRNDPDVDVGPGAQDVDLLIASLYGTTPGCREDPGVEAYRGRLAAMDDSALQHEASGFARSMHDTGLVSPYHAVLLRFLLKKSSYVLGDALGLSSTGRDALLSYHGLAYRLIDDAVHPDTAQCIYGLSLLLERGILYQSPVAPALWRILGLPLSAHSRERLTLAFGFAHDARVWLLAGTLSMLGQPLGVGQGDNPTCQSARALSMWAYNDPDYLLQIIAWAARDDEVVTRFEGRPISSAEIIAGVAPMLPIDLDAVSLLVVPHIDRIYADMVRRCAGREGDPHRWVNPELHGWWVGRGFEINVDVPTGNLINLDQFLRHFYAYYHPYYNGNQPLIHPQPAGLAVTDSNARFIGWHAITVLRVSLDPEETMRVYFYNPNNDSGQDWGEDVVVSTAGHGERFGEASLPFEQFASRLYIFHFDVLEPGEPAAVPSDELERVISRIRGSWGSDRMPGAATT